MQKLDLNSFSDQIYDLFRAVRDLMQLDGQTICTTEYLLLGILEMTNPPLLPILETLMPINVDGLRRALRTYVKGHMLEAFKGEIGLFDLQLDRHAAEVISRAVIIAQFDQNVASRVSVIHIFFAILQGDSFAAGLLAAEGITIKSVKLAVDRFVKTKANRHITRFEENVNDAPTVSGASDVLKQFTMDMTEMARQGKLDPVIGRDEEIFRVMSILMRRTKNNPLLIGEPGVGKTAIVEGLAQRIVQGDVPSTLRGKQILALDISALLAGARLRGDFEDRLRKVLMAIAEQKDRILLFIDEAHLLVGMGDVNGQGVDAANLMKPALARGELHAIAATTLDEYREIFESDGALERRFQPVFVTEPDIDDVLKILKGLRNRFEQYHDVKIDDQTIDTVVTLADRFLTDRHFPDKAIDLLDDAISWTKLQLHFNNTADATRGKKSKTTTRKCPPSKNNMIRVTPENALDVLSKQLGIDLRKASNEEAKRFLHLDDLLRQHIIGQDEAILSIADALRRARAGLIDPSRPMASFLFVGSSGVGKTETAITLAETLFGDRDALVRIDMSEYGEPHTVARLLGSPPGYVGYERGGQLTEAVRYQPYQVVLLDEIEKAHPSIISVLLQLLGDGRLTDAQGHVVNFRNTIIVMTTTLAQEYAFLSREIGFIPTPPDNSSITAQPREKIMTSLSKTFKVEFLSRIDEIIVFRNLDTEDLRKIIQMGLENLRMRLLDVHGIILNSSVDVIEYLLRRGYGNFNARIFKHLIQREIENPIARLLLAHQDDNLAGLRINVAVQSGNLSFEAVPPDGKSENLLAEVGCVASTTTLKSIQ